MNTYKRYPEPVVGAFIFNGQDELLLIKMPKWEGKYVCPGGHIEWEETIEHAIQREVKEETGLEVSDIQFLNVWDYIPDGTYHKNSHMIFLNHTCHTKNTAVILNDEAEEYIWKKPEEALKLNLESFTRKTIEQYLLH